MEKKHSDYSDPEKCRKTSDRIACGILCFFTIVLNKSPNQCVLTNASLIVKNQLE